MKCKVCGKKIQGKTYVGLGEYENLCNEHAQEEIEKNSPEMKENFLRAHPWLKRMQG